MRPDGFPAEIDAVKLGRPEGYTDQSQLKDQLSRVCTATLQCLCDLGWAQGVTGTLGFAGLCSCLIAGSTWLSWDMWPAKLFLRLLFLPWKHAMGKHRGTNQPQLCCALRQTALVYPCSSKGSETCLRSAEKRTSWRSSACWCWWPQPPSQGIPAEHDFVPSLITQPCLATPSCPYWLVICALYPRLLWCPTLCLLNYLLFHLLLSPPRGAGFSWFTANAPKPAGEASGGW